MRKFSELLLKYRFFILIIIALITIFFMSYTPRIRINDNFEELGLKTDPEYKKVEKFIMEFGHDNLVIVSLQCDDVLLKRNLKIVKRLENKFNKLEYVEKVLSITNAPDIRNINDSIEITKLIKDYPETEAQREKLRKRIRDNPFFINNIISSDFKTTAINIKFYEDIAKDKIRNMTIQKIRSIIKNENLNTASYAITGVPVLEEFLLKYALRDFMLCAPIAIVLLLVTMYLIFRSYYCAIFPMISVGLSVIWTFGAIAIISGELNVFSVLVPTMILVIGTSDCIHIITNYMDSIYKRKTINDINYMT